MDYVVAGFGIGAILALIGFALWELFGTAEEPGTGWLSRASIGLMLGALVIWAVTGVSLISHIDDSTGSRLVLLTTLVTVVAIVAGSLWYWRVDRALAATRPRPTKVSAQRAVAPIAAPAMASADIELTEWDSWPEREADQPQATFDHAMAEPVPSFEPEVAVEAAPTPEIETVSGEIDTIDTVEAEKVDAVAEVAEPIVPAVEAVEPETDVPSNLRQFRTTMPSQPSEVMVAEDVLIVETVEHEPHDETVADEIPDVAVAVVETVQVAEVEAPSVDQEEEAEAPLVAESDVAPVAFESSLLADVDGSLADDSGYRSPLLSDLGSDQLEGVGLAKWRPDARLTGQEDGADTPPATSSRRR